MYRELHEEIGLERRHVSVRGSTSDWIRYRLPKRYVRRGRVHARVHVGGGGVSYGVHNHRHYRPGRWSVGGRIYEPSFCDTHAGVERLCTNMPDCSIRSVWRMLQSAVDQVLGRITLKDLLGSEREMNAFPSPTGVTLPAHSPHA